MNFSLSAGDRAKLPWIAAAAAPVLIVQAFRFLGTDSLSAARANSVAVDSGPFQTVVVPTVATPEQQKALAWIKAHPTMLSLNNPLRDPGVAAPQDPPKIPDVVQSAPVPLEPPATVDLAPPPLVVTGMMGTGPDALATVNHKVSRVGDSLTNDWTLVAVDSRRRAIIVRHTDGREVEIIAKGK